MCDFLFQISSGADKDEFVSHLTLPSITKDSIYFCNAENRHGVIEDKTIVRVKRHFNIIQRTPPGIVCYLIQC